jgi:hypothetical protein
MSKTDRILRILLQCVGSRGSSGSIVSDYGLDNRSMEVRYPAETKRIFRLASCVQLGYGTHTASFPVGTGGPFLGGKARQGRDDPHLVPRS